MLVGFDARMIDHPGIGRYISNLLSAMLRLNRGDEFILFGDERKLSAINTRLPAVKIVNYNASVYSLSEQISEPFSKYNLDVLHVPHFNIPLNYKGNLVVTIHDLIYLKVPDSGNFLSRAAARYYINSAIKKAGSVIAVSENTKKDIAEISPGAKTKTEVIYEAADPIFRKITDETIKDKIRNKYGLAKDVILFVGSLKKHKNIERLIDAYSDLKSKGIAHKLVIIGRYRPKEARILNKIRTTDALYLGEIPSEDLAVIYNISSLLVMPSLYEGFGLPVLEAFACGVPVAGSFAQSIKEIAGSAALFFNPENTLEMSAAMYKIINDQALRQQLIAKGFEKVREFSWDKTAARTLQIYKTITERA